MHKCRYNIIVIYVINTKHNPDQRFLRRIQMNTKFLKWSIHTYTLYCIRKEIRLKQLSIHFSISNNARLLEVLRTLSFNQDTAFYTEQWKLQNSLCKTSWLLEPFDLKPMLYWALCAPTLSSHTLNTAREQRHRDY